MPPMDRDELGRCLRKNGRIAGQSARANDPPIDQAWSFRTTPERAIQLDDLVAACGHRYRPECLLAALDLYASLLRQEPLPDWVEITDFNKP